MKKLRVVKLTKDLTIPAGTEFYEEASGRIEGTIGPSKDSLIFINIDDEVLRDIPDLFQDITDSYE